MRIAAGLVAFVPLLIGSPAHAQGEAPPRSACFANPTQACLLAEAFALLQTPISSIVAPVGGEQQLDVAKIAELHAGAGRLADARRVAATIPSRELLRVRAVRLIGAAEARVGLAQDAADSFDQAHQLIDARNKDPLNQARALLAMAGTEAAAGLTTNAARSLAESLELALRADVNVSGCIAPSLDANLDDLLKTLTEEHAKVGDAANAARAARATGRGSSARVDALRVAAEARTAAGHFAEARAMLGEAVDAATASMSRQESSQCPRLGRLAGHLSHVRQLARIAVAQAKAGFADDAAASLAAAAKAVDAMEAAYALSPEIRRTLPMSENEEALNLGLRRSQALSDIAAALHAAGLEGAEETFARAAVAAGAVSDHRSATAALIGFAQAQHVSGKTDAARTALLDALARARGVADADTRATAILDVVDAGFALGFTPAPERAISDALVAARSVIDRERFHLLSRVAQVQLRSGAKDEAVAVFRDLLLALEAVEGERPRSAALAAVMRGQPTRDRNIFARVENPLIATAAPELVRLAQSLRDARMRAGILVMVAEGLAD